MEYEISDEHRAIFEKIGAFRLTMMMDHGRVVHHLLMPGENWLAEQAEKAEQEKPQCPIRSATNTAKSSTISVTARSSC